MEPQDVIQTGDATDVAVVITGTFPGSPLELDFFFTLRDGKIAALATG
jgi:ketosteroid isomerase-like protein